MGRCNKAINLRLPQVQKLGLQSHTAIYHHWNTENTGSAICVRLNCLVLSLNLEGNYGIFQPDIFYPFRA